MLTFLIVLACWMYLVGAVMVLLVGLGEGGGPWVVVLAVVWPVGIPATLLYHSLGGL